MKKKNYLLLATAAIALVACTADDDLSAGKSTTAQGDGAIMFNMETPASTRADGTEDEANKLNKEFIVWGEKNEQDGATALTSTDIVFENYRVKYTAGSANKTVSNTKNWEYVGFTPYAKNVTPSIASNKTQTIKYWDFGKTYTFTAVSALESDINDDKVKITKNYGANSKVTKGYTIELGVDASVRDIYVADRIEVTRTKPATAGTAVDPVQLSFRSFQSKIRFGIYENVPGYKVVITGIKYNDAERKGTDATGDKYFGVEGNFIHAGTNTKYEATYTTDGKAEVNLVTTGDNGQTVTPASKDTLETGGTNWLSTSFNLANQTNCIGETAATATYDRTDGTDKKAYTAILPNPSNTENLKLEISYELYSEDTGERISVEYKTAEVPAQYCTWKPNYAYTYLFKITDKSADLYPITFDAVVVEDETGNQETITTVSEPSITTYVKGKSASDEYAGGDLIYAFAQDGTVTTMSAENMKLYKVVTSDANTCPITEASVKYALEHSGTKITATDLNDASYTGTDKPSYEAIPREDTGNRTITGMKWTAGASGTYYAVEYIKTTTGNSPTTTKYYKIVKVQ